MSFFHIATRDIWGKPPVQLHVKGAHLITTESANTGLVPGVLARIRNSITMESINTPARDRVA